VHEFNYGPTYFSVTPKPQRVAAQWPRVRGSRLVHLGTQSRARSASARGSGVTKHIIWVAVQLSALVWLVYSLVGPVASPDGTVSSLITRSSDQGRNFVIREITIEPGGSIGWHRNPGTVITAVKEGTLTRYRRDCTVEGVFSAGDVIVKTNGADDEHAGVNRGTVPLVLEVLYVSPSSAPTFVGTADVRCGTH
jgi:quercetin dioxygenase-like cupin family protein